jgi:hypothetical protein
MGCWRGSTPNEVSSELDGLAAGEPIGVTVVVAAEGDEDVGVELWEAVLALEPHALASKGTIAISTAARFIRI